MKHIKKVKNPVLLFLILSVLGFSNAFGQVKTLYAVIFYADNCANSKSMAPKVKVIQNKMEGKVDFVKFDFSTCESAEKTLVLAKELGLKKTLAFKKGTGFIVLVDAKSKKEKAKLTTKQSSDEMLAIVTKNL